MLACTLRHLIPLPARTTCRKQGLQARWSQSASRQISKTRRRRWPLHPTLCAGISDFRFSCVYCVQVGLEDTAHLVMFSKCIRRIVSAERRQYQDNEEAGIIAIRFCHQREAHSSTLQSGNLWWRLTAKPSTPSPRLSGSTTMIRSLSQRRFLI